MKIDPIVVQNVSVLMAFVYGMVTFFTPCMFPLIPILLPLSYSKGFKGVVWFSIGFVATYAILGILPIHHVRPRILKYFITASLITAGTLHISGKNIKSGRILKFILNREDDLPSIIFGIGVGYIWMACATPVLGGIISLLSFSKSYLRGILLMIVYSIGILIPFLTIGKFFCETLENLNEKKKKLVRIIGGMLIISTAIWIVKAL